jgi:membrane-bound lytic murein transglycosylase MltF
MNKNEVIKVHLITCSVIALLVVLSRFISNSSISEPPVAAQPVIHTHPLKFVYFTRNTTENNTLNFANEALPVNDKKVDLKLARQLHKHDFSCIQSYVLQRRAAKWFPVIEPILKAYGIPDDFKYIPMVESGFCVDVSPRGAAGIWQFMPGTARTYGLKVGHGVDERMDLRKSTIAACKYIRELYGQFKSWTLAAAAYNNGEIQLAHAIHKQNEDNYFRMHLNRETGVYVYNIVAMKEILSKPAKYGYKMAAVYTKPSPELLAYN